MLKQFWYILIRISLIFNKIASYNMATNMMQFRVAFSHSLVLLELLYNLTEFDLQKHED